MDRARAKAKPARKVERVDRKIARATGGQRSTPLVKLAGALSEGADQPPLIALSAATLMAGLVTGSPRLRRVGLRMLASHWLATQAKSLIKRRIDRTRPFVMLGGDSYHARKGHSHAKRENSFPSGHTAGAVAVARAVARDYPASASIGYAAASAAGAVQLPRGAHFLSDVLAGAAIGWLAEAAVRLIRPPAAHRPAGAPSISRRIIGAEPLIEAADRGEIMGDGTEALDAGRIASKREGAHPGGGERGRGVALDSLEREALSEAFRL